MSTLVLACEVLREELLRARSAATVAFAFLPMGLHVVPTRLRGAIAAELAAKRAVDRVVLGYGLCGNAVEGLRCPHAPIVIPRVHDCITLLTGRAARPGGGALERGTFYLSGGWMEGERALASEHARAVRRFGERKALRVLDAMLEGYHRFVFVRTDHPRAQQRERDAAALAALARLPLDAVEGDRRWLDALVNGPWDEDRFVHVRPGEPVSASDFRLDSVPCSRYPL